MRSAIPNSQKQIKNTKTLPKNYYQNILNSSYQQIIKVNNLSGKLSSRSPTKKPLSLILQSKSSRNTKPSINKSSNHSRVYSNQYCSNKDTQAASCQNADSSNYITDENVNPNPDAITARRISSLQKLTKLVIETEVRSELLAKNLKTRQQNNINEASSRPLNSNLVQISEECQYFSTTLEGRNQDSYREAQQARVQQKQNQSKHVNNIQWYEECSGDLQNQYKAPKICIEVSYQFLNYIKFHIVAWA